MTENPIDPRTIFIPDGKYTTDDLVDYLVQLSGKTVPSPHKNEVQWPSKKAEWKDKHGNDINDIRLGNVYFINEDAKLWNACREEMIAAYDKVQTLGAQMAQKGKEEMDSNVDKLYEACFPEAQSAQKADSITDLKGLGKELWKSQDAQEYIDGLRGEGVQKATFMGMDVKADPNCPPDKAYIVQKAEPCASCGRKSKSLSSKICSACLDLGITWKEDVQKAEHIVEVNKMMQKLEEDEGISHKQVEVDNLAKKLYFWEKVSEWEVSGDGLKDIAQRLVDAGYRKSPEPDDNECIKVRLSDWNEMVIKAAKPPVAVDPGWEEKYREEFRKVYSRILNPGEIEYSAGWHIDFIKKNVLGK